MRSLNKIVSIFIFLVFFSSCASHQKEIKKYKELLSKDDLQGALSLASGDKFYTDSESSLLKELEVGTLHFRLQNYYQALTHFDKAKEISDRLFTISTTKQIAGTIGSEASDNYYGEKYERSLIRYLTILTHYSLSEKGLYEAHKIIEKDAEGKKHTREIAEVILDEAKKRFHFQAAKAVLLEWNSLIESYKKSDAGEVSYKDDMLAKLVGAIIHEKANSSTDRQIALNLYRESLVTLFRYYNSYASFNFKNKEFNESYEKLPTMKEADVKAKYVENTADGTALEDYSNKKIKDWNKKNKDNVFIVWHRGLIASKEAKEYVIPLNLEASREIATAERSSFLSFSRSVLRIGVGVVPSIKYQMVQIPYQSNYSDFELLIKKGETVIDRQKGILVGPFSEMAHYTIDSKSASLALKKGARVVTKYIGALAAAYGTYKGLRESLGDDMSLLTATASYIGLSKAIERSEEADLRSWMTLPDQVRMNSFKLSEGEYEVFSYDVITKEEKSLGKMNVEKNEEIKLKTFFN